MRARGFGWYCVTSAAGNAARGNTPPGLAQQGLAARRAAGVQRAALRGVWWKSDAQAAGFHCASMLGVWGLAPRGFSFSGRTDQQEAGG